MTNTWWNWAGTVAGAPISTASPSTVAGIAETITGAVASGRRVKAVGAGHSFSSAAVTDGVLVNLDDLSGIRSIVPTRGADGEIDGADVSIWSGTRLHRLSPLLWELGLALPNLGDFAQQSIAGAISTGTHGTGLGLPGLAATIVGLQLVTADGTILDCDDEHHPEAFQAARLGLGALGVVSALTIHCVPAFALKAEERPERFSDLVADLEGFARSADHAEFFWFPHTDNAAVKRNTRLPGDAPMAPLGRLRALIDEEFLSNEAFEAMCRLCSRRPSLAPRLTSTASKLLSPKTYTDRSYSVFASARRVRFRECEYAVPLESAAAALRDLDRLIDGRDIVTAFPLEVRFAAADDVWLSTAHGRQVCYIAIHQYVGMDHTEYFRRAEQILLAAGGRPHWGKMHSLGADDLHPLYPRFDDFVAVRDRLDPDRVFGNAYLETVLPA